MSPTGTLAHRAYGFGTRKACFFTDTLDFRARFHYY